jgi:UDP-N-acetylmuramyl pentapeptide phosphotransferase/UDP-N-acetylglucosamine-1-phosphate transferase
VDALRCLFSAEGAHPRLLLPLGVLFALQIADVAQVTVSRLRRRRPIFRGGTDHLSHLLVRRGFPVPRAVLVLVLASGVCGVASLLLAFSS